MVRAKLTCAARLATMSVSVTRTAPQPGGDLDLSGCGLWLCPVRQPDPEVSLRGGDWCMPRPHTGDSDENVESESLNERVDCGGLTLRRIVPYSNVLIFS